MKKRLSALILLGIISLSSVTVNLFAVGDHPIKTASTTYGSPVIEDTTIDPIWEGATAITELHAKIGEITNDTEFSSIKTMWDEDYLYILSEVTDGEIYKNPTTIHESDCTELYFNPLKDRSNGTYDDSEYWIKIYPDGTLENHPNMPEGVVATAFLRKDGYVTQCKIPHTLYAPATGETIGFDFQINDASKELGKRHIILGWNDTINSAYKNPSVVGELIFDAPPKIEVVEESEPAEIGEVKNVITSLGDNHIIKNINALYGSPIVETTSTEVDTLWNNVDPVTDFHLKSGEIIAQTSMKTMWDNEFLYVLTEVKDGEIFKNENEKLYHESDNVELYINANKERTNTSYDEDDYWIKIFPDGFMQNHANMPKDVITNAIQTEDGYIAQYKIPHAYYEPKAGDTIGFDMQINDASKERGKRHSILGWNDTTSMAWKQLDTVGELLFMPASENIKEELEVEEIKEELEVEEIKEEIEVEDVKEEVKVEETAPVVTDAMPLISFENNEEAVWRVTGNLKTTAKIGANEGVINGSRAIQVNMLQRVTGNIAMSTLRLAPKDGTWNLGAHNKLMASITNPNDAPIQIRINVIDNEGNEKITDFVISSNTTKELTVLGVANTQVSEIKIHIPEYLTGIMEGMETASFIVDNIYTTK